MIRKLSTIYEAEKSYNKFVFKHAVDIYRLSSNQIKEMVSFLFPFSKTKKKFIPRFIPVSKFLREAENHWQSDKSRPSTSILVACMQSFFWVNLRNDKIELYQLFNFTFFQFYKRQTARRLLFLIFSPSLILPGISTFLFVSF